MALADSMKVFRHVVDRMLKNGTLPAIKLGGQYRIRTDDFLKWWDNEVKKDQKSILRDCLK